MKKLLLFLLLLSFNVFAKPVNINKADAKTIAASLNNVGEKKASEIVAYREKHGPFKKISDLENVKGIGKKTVDKNKKDILLK